MEISEEEEEDQRKDMKEKGRRQKEYCYGFRSFIRAFSLDIFTMFQ